jgi:hypothetical protein
MLLTLTEALSVVGKPLLIKQAADHSGYSFKTKDATYISYIDAFLKQASASELEEVTQYATFWNILPECKAAITKLAAYEPKATPDTAYALCEEVGDAKIRKYAAFDGDSTREAAIAFYDNRTRYPLEWRIKTAAELINRAEQFEAHIPEYINVYLHKAAGAGYPSEQSVEDMLISRREIVKKAYAQETERLTDLLGLMASDVKLQLSSSFVKQAVSCLENFDVACGLTDAYDQGLPLPEEMIDSQNILPELEKLASSSFVKLVNGAEIDVRGLRKTALAAVDPKLEKMGFNELVEVLPTLPREDADLLMHLA